MMNNREKLSIYLIRYSLLVTSIIFIGIGLIKKQYLDVFGKAVKICLECIGIG